MRIIQAYYIKEFLKILGIIALGLALIFSILDLIDKIDEFMAGNPSIINFSLYIFFNLPKYLYYLLPMALLICSLFVFSQASRNKELIALKAIGGRLKKLFYPFVFLGMLFSFFGFFIGEVVVPDFSERARELKNSLKKKQEEFKFKEGTLWMRAKEGALVNIELYLPEKKIAKKISLFTIKHSMLKKRIEAEEAEWVDGNGSQDTWILKNVNVYDIEKGTVKSLPEMRYPYLESPEFFGERIKKPEEMGIFELYRYTEKLKTMGIKDSKLKVDMNSKVSYPFTNLFMLLLGISLSVSGRVGVSLFAAGLGLFISFLYWLGYTLMLSMGYAGIFPPLLAAWIMPVIFGIIAIYLFKRIPE
jgi:lipopolysaccharide export system permease protein